MIWTNMGVWIELTIEDDTHENACQSYADHHELEELPMSRVMELIGKPMSDEEEAGWADSQ